MVQAELQSPLSACTLQGWVHRQIWQHQTLSAHTPGGQQHHRIAQLQWTAPGEKYAVIPFPAGSLQFCPLHASPWSHIWIGQILGETYHRDSPGPKQQHNHLDSYSHSVLAPSTSLALSLGQAQWRKGHNHRLLLDRTTDAWMGST